MPLVSGRADAGPQQNRALVDAFRGGAAAGAWAAMVGLALMGALALGAWLTSPATGSVADAVATAVRLWLLSHGVAFPTRVGALGIVPLGMTLVAAGWLAWIAGRSASSLPSSDRSSRSCAAHLGGTLVGYVCVGAAASLWAGPAGRLGTAVAGMALLALVAGSVGVLRGAGAMDSFGARVPEELRRAIRAAGHALLVLLGGGAAVALAGVALNFPAVVAAADSLDAGAVGNVLLLILQAAYLPVFAVWGASVAAGPGFAMGEGAAVTIGSSTVTEPPGLPLLAAVPTDMPWWTWMLLTVPLLAGLVAGWVGTAGQQRWPAAATSAGMVVLTGVGWAALCAAASGPLADGYYANVGPAPLVTSLAVTVEVALGAAAAWALRHHSGLPRAAGPRRQRPASTP